MVHALVEKDEARVRTKAPSVAHGGRVTARGVPVIRERGARRVVVNTVA